MAELVDALVSGASPARGGSSSLLQGTNKKLSLLGEFFIGILKLELQVGSSTTSSRQTEVCRSSLDDERRGGRGTCAESSLLHKTQFC